MNRHGPSDKLLRTNPEPPTDTTTIRRWSRYKVELRVRIVLPDHGAIYGQANDISEGGMSVFVPTQLRLGDAVSIDVVLPYSSDKVRLRGVVRSAAGFRYGIEFSNPTDLEQQVLVRTCKALSMVQ